MAPIGGVRAGYLSAGRDAIPDSVVDQFEEKQYEDKGNTLSDYYSGDLTDFTRQQSTVIEGSYSLESSRDDNTNTLIKSTTGLNTFPEQGDTFRFAFRTGGGDDLIRTYFGVPAEDTTQDGYQILTSNAFDDFEIRVGSSTIASRSESFANDTTYEVEIDWTTSGDITATLFDAAGSQIGDTISATDTTYSAGGIGFRAGRTGAETVFWDNYRLI